MKINCGKIDSINVKNNIIEIISRTEEKEYYIKYNMNNHKLFMIRQDGNMKVIYNKKIYWSDKFYNFLIDHNEYNQYFNNLDVNFGILEIDTKKFNMREYFFGRFR